MKWEFILAIICFVIAGVLIAIDRNGWGWFLLLGVIALPSIPYTHKDEN